MNNFNTPNFSNFGIIANSIGPLPEAFLIKEVADQNSFYNSFDTGYKYHPHNNSCYDYNNPLWDEEDEEYNYNEYNDEEEW